MRAAVGRKASPQAVAVAEVGEGCCVVDGEAAEDVGEAVEEGPWGLEQVKTRGTARPKKQQLPRLFEEADAFVAAICL